jgi:MoaD family protein
MAIRIQIPTPMRQHADGQSTVEVNASTVQGVLAELGAKFPALSQRIFDNGQVRRFVNLYLNDEDIRYLDNLATPVKDGDELAIIPAVAGG